MTRTESKSTELKSTFMQVKDLILDPDNPRLKDNLRGDSSQSNIAQVIEMGFDAISVAESMVKHQFFPSEPLIVIPGDNGKYVVIEGNRRFTAIMGLVDKKLRSLFSAEEKWRKLAEKSEWSLETKIPVIVHASREACHPVVGFRHISGILGWHPYAQAAYIADLVDDGGKNYEEVGELVGKKTTEVANLYREHAIAKQAKTLGIECAATEGGLQKSFSLLTVAMTSPKIREFVGAKTGKEVNPAEDPIPQDKTENLKEVLGYIFGEGSQEPAIKDSRQINTLGTVIGNPLGLQALRDGKTLQHAKQLIDDQTVDPLDRLKKRLDTAQRALIAAGEDIADYSTDTDVINFLEEIENILQNLSLK